MNEPRYRNRREPNRKPLIIIGVVAAVLIAVILLISGGSDDPVVNDLVPPINTAQMGTTGPTFGEEPEYVGPPAVDGAPDPEVVDANSAPVGPHADETSEAPETEATDVGPYIDTATRFAQLEINRPSDAGSSIALNKKLVELSTGALARDLDTGQGEVQTSQVASEGEVFKTIPIAADKDYAEVLVVTRQSIVDQASGVTLDPKYINYIVRLEKVPGGDFAVTSWEPQI